MSAIDKRPGALPVAILALVCLGMVWSFAYGRIESQWASWLAAFLTMELWAVVHRAPGATFSERLWNWLGIRPRRPLRMLRIVAAALFLCEFALHVVTGGAYWWSGGLAILGTAVPLGGVIGWGIVEEEG